MEIISVLNLPAGVLVKKYEGPGAVVHTCNPRSGAQYDHSLRPAQEKKLVRPYLKRQAVNDLGTDWSPWKRLQNPIKNNIN
jgi:hypothetical protein